MLSVESYTELTDKLNQVSQRALEMKKESLKLLNKVGTDMNDLISRTQELVQSCLAGRNEFIREMELIQTDILDLNSKINTIFTSFNSSQTSRSTSRTASLQRILDEDTTEHSVNSEPQVVDNRINIMIPDTCAAMDHDYIPGKVFGSSSRSTMNSGATSISSNGRLVVRDTLDVNADENYFNLSRHNESKALDVINETDEEDPDRLDQRPSNKYVKNLSVPSSNLISSSSSSTPLTVKRKLQETGLLDLTNSPSTNVLASIKSQFDTPTKKPPTPSKYIQTTFSPIVEYSSNSNDSDNKKVRKLVITPSKSPARSMRLQRSMDNDENAYDPNTSLKDKSLDYSFEFREQMNKNARNKGTIGSSGASGSKLSKPKTPSSPFLKSKPDSKTSQGNRNNKKMKQLTMTQAFSQAAAASSIVAQNENSKKKSEERIQEESIGYDDYQENEYGGDPMSRSELAAEFARDYDKVPKKKSDSPNYKHVQVVRKHDERKKLNTFMCRECENYWKSFPEDARPKRLEENCRHRAKYQAPPTPEHYWSVAFPTTQECIDRGYGGVLAENDTDDPAAKRPRRKRPLQLITKEKNSFNGNDDDDDLDFG